ncbi:MAG TPA: hypothetical protein VLY46_04265 [Usitatibacter sp.]|nr:hypothetical protein [Usitatibacter sp.]
MQRLSTVLFALALQGCVMARPVERVSPSAQWLADVATTDVCIPLDGEYQRQGMRSPPGGGPSPVIELNAFMHGRPAEPADFVELRTNGSGNDLTVKSMAIGSPDHLVLSFVLKGLRCDHGWWVYEYGGDGYADGVPIRFITIVRLTRTSSGGLVAHEVTQGESGLVFFRQPFRGEQWSRFEAYVR